VPHVLGEVVKAVPPVVERAGSEHEHQRHDRDAPQGHAAQVIDGEPDGHRVRVAVAENRRGDAQGEAENKAAASTKRCQRWLKSGRGYSLARRVELP